MFFTNRRNASSVVIDPSVPASESTRRRLAVAILAVSGALVLPLGAPRLLTARADAPAAAPGTLVAANADASALDASITTMLASMEAQASSDDLLRRGADELRRKQYEEALTTLSQVDAKSWSDKDRQNLNELIAKAKQGAEQRQAARAEFEQGQAALAANNPAAAVAHFKNAANNEYADDGTRAKAKEQLAVATDAQRKSLGDMKSLYSSAEKDYKDGNYPEAQAKFMQLEAAGYSAPLFHKSPSDYLKDISKKMASQPQPAAPSEQASADPAAAAAAGAGTAAAAAPLTKEEIANAYKVGRAQYRSGDWINARANLTVARDNGYKAGLFEDSPEKMLSRMDRKEQADAAKALRDAPPPEPAPAPAETAAAGAAGAAAGTAAASAENKDAPANTTPAPAAEPGAQQAQQTQPGAADTTAPAAQATQSTSELQQTAEMQKIKAAADATRARDLVEQADKLAATNNLEQALALYTEAATLDPTNTRAATGRNQMMELTGRKTASSSILDERQKAIETQRQAIQYRFDNALSEAETAITANNYTDAQRAMDRARVARNSNPNIFTPTEMNAFDTRIVTTQNRLDAERAKFEQAQSTAQANQAASAINARQAQIEKARQETVAGLIAQSRRLTDDGKYEQALGVVDQILVIDPGNDYAVGVRPLIEDRAMFQQQRKYREQFDRNFTSLLNQAEEKRIPYSDILIYPENWPDLSEMRERSTAEERGEVKEDAQVQAQLDKRLPELRFDAVAFSDVVDFLRDVTGSNLFVNWRALETAGVDKNAPVTARLRDVKFSKALSTILNDVGGGTVKLAYTIDEGVITISTEEDLSKNVVTRVYDIRDLIINIPDFDNAPDFNISQANTGGRGGGGGGQSLFGGGGGGNQDEQNGATRQELVDSIVRLIQDTVASETWKDNGGTVGSLRELSGQLIVTQTPENQLQLVKLLEQLRETRAIQVTIETRFLLVQRNFLEDVGVDFDFRFNNLDSNFNGGVLDFQQNSADFTQASNMDTTLPGNLATLLTGSSLSTSFTYIDDFQARVLIRATQAEQSNSTVTAPRVTLFNGQRAYVLVATTRAYVSDLTPVVGSNAASFDPTIDTVQSGVLLDVQATVSSDRKYVTLTLRPQLSRLLALVPFAIGGTTIIPDDSSTQPFSNAGVIQQPEIQITEVRTTVSVPDGGTLLLGGQTLSGEIEREAGVPVLSKVPFLKRLFTNRSMAHDDQVLLILVKPTIIIQREQEAKQFPLMKGKT